MSQWSCCAYCEAPITDTSRICDDCRRTQRAKVPKKKPLASGNATATTNH